MKRNKIKARLVEKGVVMADIARELGVTRQAIYMTLSGTLKSTRIQEALAQRLGTTPDKLWRKAA